MPSQPQTNNHKTMTTAIALVPPVSEFATVPPSRSPRDIQYTLQPADTAPEHIDWQPATGFEMQFPTDLGLGYLWEYGHLHCNCQDENGEKILLRFRIEPAVWEKHQHQFKATTGTAA